MHTHAHTNTHSLTHHAVNAAGRVLATGLPALPAPLGRASGRAARRPAPVRHGRWLRRHAVGGCRRRQHAQRHRRLRLHRQLPKLCGMAPPFGPSVAPADALTARSTALPADATAAAGRAALAGAAQQQPPLPDVGRERPLLVRLRVQGHRLHDQLRGSARVPLQKIERPRHLRGGAHVYEQPAPGRVCVRLLGPATAAAPADGRLVLRVLHHRVRRPGARRPVRRQRATGLPRRPGRIVRPALGVLQPMPTGPRMPRILN